MANLTNGLADDRGQEGGGEWKMQKGKERDRDKIKKRAESKDREIVKDGVPYVFFTFSVLYFMCLWS